MCENCEDKDAKKMDRCKVGIHLDCSDQGGPDIYIKNVKALICPECSEVFFQDDVTAVLKDIKEGLASQKGELYIDFDLISGGIINV